MNEINPLTDKAALTVRLHETKADYDTVREDMEEHLGLSPIQWASVDLLCDVSASFRLAVMDAERAGYEPGSLLS